MEKDDILRVREGQLEAKERVLAERDALVHDLTEQLEEKTKAMEKMQGVTGGQADEKVKFIRMIGSHLHLNF